MNRLLVALITSLFLSINSSHATTLHEKTCMQDCEINLPETAQEVERLIEEYNYNILMSPHNWKLRTGKGLILRCLRNFNESITSFSEAIRIAPNEESNYIYRAETYRCIENFNKSVQDYTKAIEIDQNNSKYYTYRARAYTFLDNKKEALKDFETALKINSSSDFTYYIRSEYFISNGKYKEAISDISKAIKINNAFPAYNFIRGYGYYLTSDYSKAISDFTTYLKHQPDNSDALNFRGKAYFHTGRIKKAAQDLETALKISPGDTYIAAALSETLSSCPKSSVFDPKRAQQLAQQVVNTAGTPSNLELLARAHAAQSDFQQAIKLEKEALILIEDSKVRNKTIGANELLKLYEKNKTHNWCPPHINQQE